MKLQQPKKMGKFTDEQKKLIVKCFGRNRSATYKTGRHKAGRHKYWWMQDGAPPHCTNLSKQFLLEKFNHRVISRGTPVAWPAHSPDLNPLDFHFWGVAQQHIYREQPDNIEALIQCVSAFAATYDSGTIRKVSENVLKRAKQCSDVNGDHFQHLLK